MSTAEKRQNNELYIVTGAAGNLGSALVRQLLQDGKDVRAFVLPGEHAAMYLPEGAQIIPGDVTDTASLDRLFSDIPADTAVYVLHCAAMVSVSVIGAERVWNVNVGGTQNIIDRCLEHGARLIYMSSTGAIPEQPMGVAIKEVSYFNPETVIGVYDKTKAAATQLVLEAVKHDGLDACIMIPSGISGPGDYTFGNLAGIIRGYAEGKVDAGIAGTINCVDNRDLAVTIIRACKDGRRGESYVLGGDMITMKEIFDILSERTGLPPAKFILPAKASKAVAKLGDGAEKLTHRTPKMTSFTVYNLLRNNEFDSSKAEKELGYTHRPLVQSIADEIDWMIDENLVTIHHKH